MALLCFGNCTWPKKLIWSNSWHEIGYDLPTALLLLFQEKWQRDESMYIIMGLNNAHFLRNRTHHIMNLSWTGMKMHKQWSFQYYNTTVVCTGVSLKSLSNDSMLLDIQEHSETPVCWRKKKKGSSGTNVPEISK